MTSLIAPNLCIFCTHLHRDVEINVWECDAYPMDIPLAIRMNERDHRQPLPGDNGIQFEVSDLVDTEIPYELMFK